jgi:hypothetical protein
MELPVATLTELGRHSHSWEDDSRLEAQGIPRLLVYGAQKFNTVLTRALLIHVHAQC